MKSIGWIVLTWMTLSVNLQVSSVHGGELHPFHICIGEMEWNEAEGKWEISLRMHPSDLQTAVSRVAGSRVEIDPEKKEIPELTRYLQSHFRLGKEFTEPKGKIGNTDPKANSDRKRNVDEKPRAQSSESKGENEVASNGENSKLPDPDARFRWVGMELERGWIWVYFEIDSPKEERELFLTHQVLLKDVENQVNTIVVKRGDRRTSLRFVPGKESQKLP